MNGTNTAPIVNDKEVQDFRARTTQKTPRRPKSPPVDTAVLRAEADAQVAASQPKSRTPKTSDVSLKVTPVAHAVAAVAKPAVTAVTEIAPPTGMMKFFSVNGIECKVDAEGRVRINAIHAASGGLEKHKPKYWLALQSTKELERALIARKSEGGIPPSEENKPTKVVRGVGQEAEQGTYADRDMLCAYAQWISADFGLEVARIVDKELDRTGGRLVQGETAPAQVAIEAKPAFVLPDFTKPWIAARSSP